MSIIRDDFAGPGGWEEGLRILREEHGITHAPCIGVESEASAVATARAAGQIRLHDDVRVMQPTLGHSALSGYIASPPCQTFSAAGKGSGRKNLAALRAAAVFVSEGMSPETAIAAVQTDELDERSVLVLHPLTVIRDARPPWVALEQVPAVLPIWETYAEIMREEWDYSVRIGYVHSEEYGVAQTRKRAVLVAVLDGEAPWPTKTHSRYHARDRERIDPGSRKWVSMAEALGWADDRFKVMGDVRASHGTVRDINHPAPTITSSLDNGNFQFAGAGATARTTAGQVPRDLAEPTHTITGKGTAAWTPTDTLLRSGQTVAGGDRAQRDADEPSLTVTSTVGRSKFVPRDALAAETGRRVTVEEAAVLQSFRADYPWRGNKGQQYQQVGNAIPPRLAAAILLPLLRE